MGCGDAWNLRGLRGRRRLRRSRRGRVGRNRRIKNRLLVTPPEREEIETDTSQKEQRREDRRRACQRVGCSAWREQATKTGSAPTHAERTALGPLQQDEYDEGSRNEDFRDYQQSLQFNGSRAGLGGSIDESEAGGKPDATLPDAASGRWRVVLRNSKTNSDRDPAFDGLMVANGGNIIPVTHPDEGCGEIGRA